MRTLTIPVTNEILESIASEARRRHISRKRVIEERLQQPAQPSAWDLMKDLVIDSDDSPRDLSTNKKYMEGYGKSRTDRERTAHRHDA